MESSTSSGKDEKNEGFDQRTLVDTSGIRPHEGNEKCPGGQVRMISLAIANRVAVAAVGRRFGKTAAAKLAIIEKMRRHTGRTFYAAYCGPTFGRVKPEYDEMKKLLGGMVHAKSDSDLWLKLRNVQGADGNVIKEVVIRFLSLDKPDNLRGFKFDFIVIDECSEVSEEAYTAVLKPMTLDTEGTFLLIGTPRRVGVGFVWFRREFFRGLDPYWQKRGYASMRGPSDGNPYLKSSVLQQLADETPDPLSRREEYHAEFLDDVGAVFEGLSEAFVVPSKELHRNAWEKVDLVIEPDDQFVIGYDIGLHDDHAIITVFNRDTKEQVFLWRGVSMPFRQQFAELIEIKARFNDAVVYADANGMGEVPREDMAREFGKSFRPKKWSNKSKEEDVTRGMVLFQETIWKFLNVDWQRTQFQEFTRKKLPSGVWRYEHPPGGKDDAVCAALMPSGLMVLEPRARARKKPPVLMYDRESGAFNFDYFERKAAERRRRRRGRRW